VAAATEPVASDGGRPGLMVVAMSRARSSDPGEVLPIATTRFVGRRRELAEVRRLLGEARLVTYVPSPCRTSRRTSTRIMFS
jgi:hypothetical protein